MLYAKVEPQERKTICTEMRSAPDVKWYRRLKIMTYRAKGMVCLS